MSPSEQYVEDVKERTYNEVDRNFKLDLQRSKGKVYKSVELLQF